MLTNKNNIILVLVTIITTVAIILLSGSVRAALVGNANQATLSVSPSTGSYNINDNFTVGIYVNTHGQSVVVVAAYLNYDKDHFQALSIDSTGSIFTMQAENSIDSANGVIKITRGIPTPGVNTNNGLVAAINFKAVSGTSPSSDNLTFQFTAGATTESNVILNDGLGTDYLSGVYNGIYSVTGSGSPVPTPPPSSPPSPSYTPIPTPTPAPPGGSPTPMPQTTPPPGGWAVGNRPRPSQFNLKEGNTVAAYGSNDPDVYIINDAGFKRLFLNPVIFNFYGHLGGFKYVKTIVATTRDAFETSGLFRNCETNDPKVYGVETTGEDTGTLHWVNTTGNQAVADDPEFFLKVFCINNNEFNWYTQNNKVFGTAYTSVNQIPRYIRR